VNCKITIFAEANIQATNSSGSAKKVNAVLSIQGYDSTAATFIGDERVYKRDIQNAESWQDTPSMTYQIDAIAGRTYTIGLYYSDNIARTQVSELTKIRLRLELIKR
jgi:alpha-galactosidase